MKNVALAIVAFAMSIIWVAGCERNSHNSKKTRSENSFEDAVSVDAHPVAGRVYSLDAPDYVGGVKSTGQKDIYYIPGDQDISVPIIILSTCDYCDGELLHKGMYKYEGGKTVEVPDYVEIGEEVKSIMRKVKCRSFVEVAKKRLTAPK